MCAMSTPTITDRLDRLEASLPAVPARVVRLQRNLAGAWYDRTAALFNAFADSTKTFLETTRESGKTVTGQARAQGRRISDTATAETTQLLDKAIDAVDDHPGSGTPYEQWTKAQLLDRATDLGVEGRSGMNKAQLIKALRNA
jgi:hypothetical protein